MALVELSSPQRCSLSAASGAVSVTDSEESDAVSITDSEQSEFDADAFRRNLFLELENVGNGSFAASGFLPAINPGLSIAGLGKVGLPLSDRDAAELCRICHQAPFGKGSETFVDTSVRKTWELNGDQVTFRNPLWRQIEDQALAKATEQLGIINGPATIRADLYKLLLYEPGAFFETHRDTEKAPGMIATMIISLPSEHVGGEVALSLGNKKQNLQTEAGSEFETRYLAWYADVNHAVKPVISGYRFVLTYNLIRQDAATKTITKPSALYDTAMNIQSALSKWALACGDECRDSRMLYMLEHDYSEANFGLAKLKGKDQLRARYLTEAAKPNDVCVYLAHFEHTKSGGCDDDDEDIHEIIDEVHSDWKITTLFTPEGAVIASGMELNGEEFIGEVNFQDGPDDEEYEGWTGNEGANTTHFYRRSCIVMFPRGERGDFISAAEFVAIDKWSQIVLEESEANMGEDAELIWDELARISAKAAGAQRSPMTIIDPKPIVDVALRRHDPVLLKLVADKPLDLELFKRLGSSTRRASTEDWMPTIQKALSQLLPGRKRLQAMDDYVAGFRDTGKNDTRVHEDAAALEQSVIKSLPEIWKYDKDETAGDAEALVSLSLRHDQRFITDTLLPLAKKSTNISFVIALAKGVREQSRLGHVNLEVATDFCTKSLSSLVFTIRQSCPHLNKEWQTQKPLLVGDEGVELRWVNHVRHEPAMSAQRFVDLVRAFGELEMGLVVEKLFDLLVQISWKVGFPVFYDFLFPILNDLPLPELPDAQYQRLFQQMLRSFIDNYVGRQPVKPKDWQRKPCGCGCAQCTGLDRFLSSPNRESVSISTPTPQRKHLEKRLGQTDCKVSTDKTSWTPYSLVITKVEGDWRKYVAAWQERQRQAGRLIEKLGKEKLSPMLGDNYGELMAAVGLSKDAPPGLNQNANGITKTPLTEVSQTQADSRGNKRHHDALDDENDPSSKRAHREVEVVDLCDQDD